MSSQVNTGQVNIEYCLGLALLGMPAITFAAIISF